MFHYIKGRLTMKFDSGIVLEAGGLGYEIFVPGNAGLYMKKDGEEVTVYTAMMVREDDVSLYGFEDKEGLAAFRKLITVSGVGAKAAMSILSAMPLHEVRQAIVCEDPAALTRANGIGKKTAERIVLDLKDKFGQIDAPAATQGTSGAGAISDGAQDAKTEALHALIALGYSKGEAANALATVKAQESDTEAYIKQALKHLF